MIQNGSFIFIKKFACIIFAIHLQWDTKINIFADIAFVGLRSSQNITKFPRDGFWWILDMLFYRKFAIEWY